MTTQQPLIEATLFRIEQIKPFFTKLNSYRDERMLLSFPRDFWMELKKPNCISSDGYIGDRPYAVTGIKSEEFPKELMYLYNLARLFDARNVRVQAYTDAALALDPLAETLGVNDLMVKLIGFSDPRQRRRNEDGVMLNTARIWRMEQLLGLTDWVNSYRDWTLELCVSSATSASILLEKPALGEGEFTGDLRYDVTGASHPGIAERIANVFEQTPVTVAISNTPGRQRYEPIPRAQLETFLVGCAKRYRDSLF